jgi:hypothetical protein
MGDWQIDVDGVVDKYPAMHYSPSLSSPQVLARDAIKSARASGIEADWKLKWPHQCGHEDY